MPEIVYIPVQPLVRRKLVGARLDDPVLPERQPRRRQARRSPRTGRRWRPALTLRGTS
jgi:hypothetical protein